MVSSAKPTLPCRHIHHINTLKDGWIIGTGEIYPNGWLLYLQQKKADTYSITDASEELIIRRINTKNDSVQRTMGVILNDSSAGDLIYASDHDTLERNAVNDSSLSGISRSSMICWCLLVKEVSSQSALTRIIRNGIMKTWAAP